MHSFSLYAAYKKQILFALSSFAVLLFLLGCEEQKEFEKVSEQPEFRLLGVYNVAAGLPTNDADRFRIDIEVSNGGRVQLIENTSSCVGVNDEKFSILTQSSLDRVYSEGVSTILLKHQEVADGQAGFLAHYKNCQLGWRFVGGKDNVEPLKDFYFDNVAPTVSVKAPTDALLPIELRSGSKSVQFMSSKQASLRNVGNKFCLDLVNFSGLQPNKWSPNIPINAGVLNDPGTNGGVTLCEVEVVDAAQNKTIESFEISVRKPNFTASLPKKNYQYPTNATVELEVEGAGWLKCFTDQGVNCLVSPVALQEGKHSVELHAMFLGTDSYNFSFTPEGIDTPGTSWDIVQRIESVKFEAEFDFNVILAQNPSESVHGKIIPLTIRSQAGGDVAFSPTNNKTCPYKDLSISKASEVQAEPLADNYQIGADYQIGCKVVLTVKDPVEAFNANVTLQQILGYTLDKKTPEVVSAEGLLEVELAQADGFVYKFEVSEPVRITADSCNQSNVGGSFITSHSLIYSFTKKSTDCIITVADRVPANEYAGVKPSHTAQILFTAEIEPVQFEFLGPSAFSGNSGRASFRADNSGHIFCRGPVDNPSIPPRNCFTSTFQQIAKDSPALITLADLEVGRNSYEFLFIPVPPGTSGDKTNPFEVKLKRSLNVSENPVEFKWGANFSIPDPANRPGADFKELKIYSSLSGDLVFTPNGGSGNVCPEVTGKTSVNPGLNNIAISITGSNFPDGAETKINCKIDFTETNVAAGSIAQEASLLLTTLVDQKNPTLSPATTASPDLEIAQISSYPFAIAVSERVTISVDPLNCVVPLTDLDVQQGLHTLALQMVNPTTGLDSWSVKCTFVATDYAGNVSAPLVFMANIPQPAITLKGNHPPGTIPTYETQVGQVDVVFTATAKGVLTCKQAGASCGSTKINSANTEYTLSLTGLAPGTSNYTLVYTPGTDALSQSYKIEKLIRVTFDSDVQMTVEELPEDTVSEYNGEFFVTATRDGNLTLQRPTTANATALRFTSIFPTTLKKGVRTQVTAVLPADCDTFCEIDVNLVFTESETGYSGSVIKRIQFTVDKLPLALVPTNPYNPAVNRFVSVDTQSLQITFGDAIAINPDVKAQIQIIDYDDPFSGVLYSFPEANLLTSGNSLQLKLPSATYPLLKKGHVFVSIPKGKIVSAASKSKSFPGTCVSCEASLAKSWHFNTKVDAGMVVESWNITPTETNSPVVPIKIECTQTEHCLDGRQSSAASLKLKSAKGTEYNVTAINQQSASTLVLEHKAFPGDENTQYYLSYDFSITATAVAPLPGDFLQTLNGVVITGNITNTNWLLQYKDDGLLKRINDGQAIIAYSLRKLRADYTGNAIQVMAMPSNAPSEPQNKPSYATAEIGFDINGDLDLDAINDFIANNYTDGGQIAISKWYNQSAANTDERANLKLSNYRLDAYANMPVIYDVNRKDVFRQNGKPAIFFPGRQSWRDYPNNQRSALWAGVHPGFDDDGKGRYIGTVSTVLTASENGGFAFGWHEYNGGTWAAHFNKCIGSRDYYFSFVLAKSNSSYRRCYRNDAQQGRLANYTIITRNQDALLFIKQEQTVPKETHTNSSIQNIGNLGTQSFSVGRVFDRSTNHSVSNLSFGQEAVGGGYMSELIIFNKALSTESWQIIAADQQRYYNIR